MASTNILQLVSLFVLLFTVTIAQPTDGFLRKVSTAEIFNDLEASLADILDGHAPAAASKRIAVIEASTWQTFQSMPKNAMGRLGHPAVRHVVHGYFAREHGWQIKGLEPHGMQANATKVHDMNILQDKAPMIVEGLLAGRHQDNGLGFTDIVAMVAVLEQLIFDESVTLLEAAYRLNGESVADDIEEAVLHRLLTSYLVLFGQGSQADLSNATRHHASVAAKNRNNIKYFESNVVSNFDYARRHQTNPFVPRRYSFEVVAEIVAHLAERYGKWQNAECSGMRAHLVELDPEGTGRVPLGLLYAQPQHDFYHFTESSEYLRKVGALDETTASAKVLISNYVSGPSNCIASSSYYSVCCLSSCDSIMDEIEHKVLAPTASSERLLGFVRNILNVQDLPCGLSDKLQAIADRHAGEVPIHGRLFAQWLHFAFPHECPFPAIVESAEVLKKSQWPKDAYTVSSEERLTHLQPAETAVSIAEDVQVADLWSDHEVLPAHDEPQSPLGATGAGLVRVAVQFAALCLILRSVHGAWRAAVGSGEDNSSKAKRDDDFAVPLGFNV